MSALLMLMWNPPACLSISANNTFFEFVKIAPRLFPFPSLPPFQKQDQQD